MTSRARIARRSTLASVSASVALALAGVAHGQAAAPTAWVLNNVSGDVTPVTLAADGTPTAAPPVEAAAFPQCASLSPDGRWLAVGHATDSTTTEVLLVFAVAGDGSLTLVHETLVPDSPLDCAWLSGDLLAVSRSNIGGTNEVRTFQWNAERSELTPADAVDAGTFHTSLAVHPELPVVYGQDSFGNVVRWWTWDATGTLTPAGSVGTGSAFPLDITMAPDGRHLYAGGGISAGGNAVLGFAVGPAGDLIPLAGSPFTSPGASPAHLAVTGPGDILAVGHGSDATIRTFTREPRSGVVTATGFSFDVGLQGTVGDVTALGSRLLVTDESTAIDGIAGLYVFDVDEEGSLVQVAPILPTGGVRPETIVTWPGITGGDPDIDGDGVVGIDDLLAVLAGWGGSDPAVDIDGSGLVDLGDLLAVLGAWTG